MMVVSSSTVSLFEAFRGNELQGKLVDLIHEPESCYGIQNSSSYLLT